MVAAPDGTVRQYRAVMTTAGGGWALRWSLASRWPEPVTLRERPETPMAAMRVVPLLVLATVLLVSPSVWAQRVVENPVALANSGWTAVEERRFGDAIEAFTAASEQVPDEPTFWLGRGVAAYILGRNDEAESSLERTLDLEPRLVDASRLLGELQYRAGRLREAIATYEAALKVAPDDRDLVAKVEDWTREDQLQGRFYQSRGAHFRVLFEGPADDVLARRVVDILEAAYWRIGGMLTTYPPEAVTVVFYTQEQFQDVTRSPSWAAGMYDGQIRVPVRGALDRPTALERVLTHEFVHALVAGLGGRTVPVWLNEGLATVFEPGGAAEATAALAGVASRPRLRDLHGSFAGLPAAVARIAYAHSAVAVERMIDLRGAPAVVILLRDLARGERFESAFRQRMSIPYEDFERMVAR